MTINIAIKKAAVVPQLTDTPRVPASIDFRFTKLCNATATRLKEPAMAEPVQHATADNDKITLSLSTAISTEVPKGWDEIIFDYRDNVQTIDLRPLDIDQAMSEMLGELRCLPAKTAFLFVLHSRLPVPFLDKLTDDKFDYHIKVISDGEINILIFKC